MQPKAQPHQTYESYQSYQEEGGYQLPSGRKPAVGLGVVVLLHLLFFWALNAGLGRELLHSAPVLVVAQLLTAEPPPVPTALPPPPKTATPLPTSAAPLAAPVLEPTPVAAVPAPAMVLAPTSPAPAPTPTSVPAAVAYAPPPPAVRVAATLQASGSCQKPEYPALSRKREEQGSVVLKFLIGVDGRVMDSQIEQSSGYVRLDEAARAGLSKCQFKPGTVDGNPEASWATLRYTWNLE